MKRSLLVVFASLVVAASYAHSALSYAAGPSLLLDGQKLKLASANVLVLDAQGGNAIYAKGADTVTPIASVTKLMTSMVVLDAGLPMEEPVSVGIDDIDLLRGSHSRLRMGTELPRREMLRLALMASENRAASSLARHYPGGRSAFVDAMNRKAQSLGMTHTHFADSTGLSSQNVSTANDLARMVKAASEYDVIRDFTTTASHFVELQPTGQVLGFNNTNALVRNGQWDIQVSKTGFIKEAGKCLVMLATVASRPVVIVLLDSYGKLTRIADAQRVKYWLETGETMPSASSGRVARHSFKPNLVKASFKSASRSRSSSKARVHRAQTSGAAAS
jgi:D-alanyl-D-alanine endopeptidase (penicillin-binding protein 7)